MYGAGNAIDGVAGYDAGQDQHGFRNDLGSCLAGEFVSPIVGGILVPSLGLRNVLLANLVFRVLAITSMYMLPKTGLGQ